jgi:hypothetical protein
MCVSVSNFGDERPWARGMERLIFMPGYAAACSIVRRSRSRPLFSAFASALSRTWSVFAAAFMGYLPAKAFSMPRRCAAFLLYLVSGTGCFLVMTLFRYVFALESAMPLIVLHTSRVFLWDTRISRPLAFAVFSGSSSSVCIEYPHFGILCFLSDCAIQQRNGDLYGFPYQY